MKAIAVVALLATGCFGYNPSAKKWAYVGNAVLIAGGGAAIGGSLATRPGPCMAQGCYNEPLDGMLVAGALLVAAGVIGIVVNATRDEVKTSR
jgi:hypothetical protein